MILKQSIAEAQIEQTNRKPIEKKITSYSVDKAYLGMKISDLKKAYSDFEFSEVSLYEYGIDSENKGLLISKAKKKVMFVWTMAGDDKIKGIYCLTNEIETENRIKVGSTVNDILKLYPKLSLKRDCLDMTEEYSKLDDIGILIIFLTTDKNRVGIYLTGECQETTIQFDLERKIDRIKI